MQAFTATGVKSNKELVDGEDFGHCELYPHHKEISATSKV